MPIDANRKSSEGRKLRLVGTISRELGHFEDETFHGAPVLLRNSNFALLPGPHEDTPTVVRYVEVEKNPAAGEHQSATEVIECRLEAGRNTMRTDADTFQTADGVPMLKVLEP